MLKNKKTIYLGIIVMAVFLFVANFVFSAGEEIPEPPTFSNPYPATGATNVSVDLAQISWSYNLSLESGYRAEIKKTSDSAWTIVCTTPNKFCSMALINLSGSTTYQWRVHALTGGGIIDATSPIWTFTTGLEWPVLNLADTNRTQNSIRWDWVKPVGVSPKVDYYEYKLDGGSFINVPSDITYYTSLGLSPNTQYTASVKACDSGDYCGDPVPDSAYTLIENSSSASCSQSGLYSLSVSTPGIFSNLFSESSGIQMEVFYTTNPSEVQGNQSYCTTLIGVDNDIRDVVDNETWDKDLSWDEEGASTDPYDLSTHNSSNFFVCIQSRNAAAEVNTWQGPYRCADNSAGGSFTITISPFQKTITHGEDAQVTVNVNAIGGFNDLVSLSITDSEPDIGEYSIESPVLPNEPATLTFENPAVGIYLYTVTGTSGSLTNTGKAWLIVEEIPAGTDIIAPTVTALDANPSEICSGSSSTLSWSAIDDVAVSRVEVWRNPGTGWARIISGDCSGDKSANGACSVSPLQTTQYGLHVIDTTGNCIDETGAHCGGVSSDSLDPRPVYGPDTVTVIECPLDEDPTVNEFTVHTSAENFSTCQTTYTIAWEVEDEAGGLGLDRVEVWRQTDGGGWTQVHTDSSIAGDGPVSGAWDDIVVCGHNYEYGIHVFDEPGNEGQEDETITADVICPVAAPSDITFFDITPTSINLEWDDNSDNESSFKIYRGTASNLVKTNGADDNNWQNNGLSCNTTSTYWVSAYGFCGESSKVSNSATTLSCGPDFSIDASPDSQTTTYGGGGNYNVILNPYNGFNGIVDLTTSGCPTGANCSFDDDEIQLYGPTENTTFRVTNAPFGIHSIELIGTGGGKTHNTFVELIVNETDGGEDPNVDAFSVDGHASIDENPVYFTTEDTTLTVAWTVSDTGGSGLDQVEVWRRASSTDWIQIYVDDSISGDGPVSGSWDNNVTCDQAYEYGLHVLDVAGNMATETTSDPPLSTITATVECSLNNAPVADFTFCKVEGTQIVQFTNTATDADGDHLDYSWDFDSRDGIQPDSAQENPSHDYEGVVYNPPEARVAGVSAEQDEMVNIFQGDIVKYKSVWQTIKDFFKNIWQSISDFFANLFQPAQAQVEEWWNEDWAHRRIITFDNSGRGALTNVPVLVSLTTSNFNFALAQSTGADIRFLDEDDETELSYEIEDWDNSSQTASVWVKVPQINNNSDSDFIYMYYGNDSVSDNQNVTAVWDSSFYMVQHLQETSGVHYDSTSRDNDSTLVLGANQDATGKIGGADSFDGDGDRIEIKAMNLGEITVEAWVKFSAFTDYDSIVTKRWTPDGSPWRVWNLVLDYTPNRVDWGVSGDDGDDIGNVTTDYLSTGQWYYIVGTYKYSDGYSKIYVNGDLKESKDSSNNRHLKENSVPVILGGHTYSDTQSLNGILDEVRISSTPRSADWIEFQYCSMTQDCVSYSTQESNGIWVTLQADDGSATDAIAKLMDFETMPNCPLIYYLTNVTENGCNMIGGNWEILSGYEDEDDYNVYRCQGSSTTCANILNYSEIYPAIVCATECYFEDTTVEDNTEYYYYVATDEVVGHNNSTDPPDCTGDIGADICPLGDNTPICPVENLSISRACGALTINWLEGEAIDFRVYKCIDRSNDKCSNSTYFTNNSSIIDIDYTCAAGSCSLIDNEIIPVNVASPANSGYYCYKISGQNEAEEWSDLPATPDCDYSYCYRAPDWQER